jgi:hypothetical protein
MIAAYGQTSSGKTHTIKGTEETPGIIVLAAREIFTGIKIMKDEVSQEVDANIS